MSDVPSPFNHRLPVVVFSVDPNGVLTLSESSASHLGLPPSGTLSENAFERFHEYPESLDELRKALSGETRWCQAEINDKWWEFKLTPELDSTGKTIGVTGIALDVSLRKDTAELLKSNERTFLLLFANNPIPMWIYDLNSGNLKEVNDAAISYLGYTRHELLTMTIHQLQPAEDAVSGIEFEPGAFQVTQEWRLQTKVGSCVEAQITSHCLPFNKYPAVLGMAQDITQFKQAQAEREKRLRDEQAARLKAEAARKRSEFLAYAGKILAGCLDLKDTLDSLASLVVPEFARWCAVDLLRSDGTIERMASRHAKPELQAILFELANDVVPNLPRSHPLMRALFENEASFNRDVTSEMLLRSTIHERHRDALMQLGIQSLIVVPLTARGRTIGAMSFGTSGERPNFTSDHFTLFTELADRAALSTDNARLYQTAQKAVAMRDEFISIASHELKTPLTALHACLQLLSMRAKDPRSSFSKDQLIKMLESSEAQSRRMIHLINDLMDCSRIGVGKLELRYQKTSLEQLCRGVLHRLNTTIDASGCEITFQSSGPAVGTWDVIRIEQVVTNLMSNALKYGRGKPIDVRVEAGPRLVFLRVRDQGIGIAREAHSRIFERFEQVASSRDHGGLGLGLYITRQILEAHGGEIRVESSPDEGATFTVELPRAPYLR